MPRFEIDIAARLAEFQDGLNSVTRNAEGAARKIDAAFGIVRQALGAIGIGLSAASFVGAIKGAIDLGDELNKLSQKIGVSVEKLSAMKFAAELSDVSIESFTKGMRAFNQSLVEARDPATKMAAIFHALGVDIKAGPREGMLQFADAVSKLGDNETKTALAMEVLKKAGIDWIPLLNQGRKGIEEAEESARRLGVTMGPDFAQKSEQFNDNVKKLQAASSRLGISLAKDMIEPLTIITNRLTKAAESGNVLRGAFVEINRLVAALLGLVGRGIGSDRLDKFATDYFSATENGLTYQEPRPAGTAKRGRIRGVPGASAQAASPYAGLIRGAQPRATSQGAEPPNPNETALQRILSGFQNPQQVREARDRLLESITKAGVDAEQDAANKRGALLDEAFSQNLISERSYYADRLAIQKDALDQERSRLDEQIGRQVDVLKSLPQGSKEYYEQYAKVEETLNKRNKLEADFRQFAAINYLAATKGAKDYDDRVQDLNIQLMQLRGNTAAAALARFDLSTRAQREKFQINNDASAEKVLDDVRRLTVAQEQYNEGRERQEEITSRLQISEERVQNTLKTGAISELDAMRQTSDLRKQAVAELEEVVRALEEQARASENPKLVLQAEQSRAALNRLRTETDLVADRFNTIFKDAASDAFSDFISRTKSGSDAFRSFADSVLRDVSRIVGNELWQRLFGNSLGGAVKGVFDRIFPASSSTASMAAAAGNNGNLEGALLGSFDVGTNYVPRTGPYRLHEGEAVITKAENKGRAASAINVSVAVDARGAAPGVGAEVRRAVAEMIPSVVGALVDAKRRGGATARAFA